MKWPNSEEEIKIGRGPSRSKGALLRACPPIAKVWLRHFSIPLRFGFVMLWYLICFLICFTMILSGCDFTVLGPMATGQSARASQCCYQATC